VQHTQYDFSTNTCVILKFNITTNENQLLIISVKDFNENSVTIPGDKHNNVFVVKAAIFFKPFSSQNTDMGAHYVCWRRVLHGDGWLEISDLNCTYHKNFLKNLNGVYLLFLEKKILMF